MEGSGHIRVDTGYGRVQGSGHIRGGYRIWEGWMWEGSGHIRGRYRLWEGSGVRAFLYPLRILLKPLYKVNLDVQAFGLNLLHSPGSLPWCRYIKVTRKLYYNKNITSIDKRHLYFQITVHNKMSKVMRDIKGRAKSRETVKHGSHKIII